MTKTACQIIKKCDNKNGLQGLKAKELKRVTTSNVLQSADGKYNEHAKQLKNAPNKHKQSPEGKTQNAKENKTMLKANCWKPEENEEVCKRAATCNENKERSRLDQKWKNIITLEMRNKSKLPEANGEHENRKAWRQGMKETRNKTKYIILTW